MFGLPGGSVVPFFDGLYDRPEVRLVCPRHEAGAMFAAAAYARATGTLGVVFVTSGPGLLNALTGLTSAHYDGTPLILVAGDVATSQVGRNALQDGSSHGFNVRATTAHLCKASFDVPNAGSALAVLRSAIDTARSGRPGAVVINIPLDIASATVPAASWSLPAAPPPTLRSDAVVVDAAKRLLDATRPVIFAGSGVRQGNGAARLKTLAEQLQIPVMTTPKGKGVFPESHPLSLGVFGHGGHGSSSAYLEAGADVVMVVGSSLGDPATNGWSELLGKAETFIQVDPDPAVIGRNYAVTHAVIGTCDATFEAMSSIAHTSTRPKETFGITYQRDVDVSLVGTGGLITPERAIHELQQALPGDTIYSIDIGEHLIFGTHYLRIDHPDSFVAMTGLASMGSSIAAAYGSQLAHPGRRVVALCGDGCLLMALHDIATAAAEELPVIVAVLNDERYGMVELGTAALYGRTRAYPLGPVDIPATARGLGATAAAIRVPGEIAPAIRDNWTPKRPLVLDIHIDRSSRMARSKRFESLMKFGLSTS